MATFNPVTHVIFDMDGLIFDTEDLYTEMYQIIAARYGKTFTWDVKIQCLGKVADDSARAFIDGLQLPMTVKEFHDSFSKLCEKYFLKSKVLPGVDRLIRHLHSNKVPIAIATSSKKETFDIKTKNHQDLIGLFNHVVCGSTDPEVKRGKPAPDVFVVCAKRFEDTPSSDKILVFEDAPGGVLGALEAGMQVVMVPDARMEPEYRKDATLVIDTMENFRPELFGLPPFKEE